MERPDGQVIDYIYEVTKGRLRDVISPQRSMHYSYDNAGRVKSIDHPEGVSLAYTYDGPLVRSETATGPVAGNVAWTYDKR